jgi:hypothetical protein
MKSCILAEVGGLKPSWNDNAVAVLLAEAQEQVREPDGLTLPLRERLLLTASVDSSLESCACPKYGPSRPPLLERSPSLGRRLDALDWSSCASDGSACLIDGFRQIRASMPELCPHVSQSDE